MGQAGASALESDASDEEDGEDQVREHGGEIHNLEMKNVFFCTVPIGSGVPFRNFGFLSSL